MIANIFVTQDNSRDQRDATARVIQTLGVLGHLDSIGALISEAEAAQRGFILTNDENYLAPYSSAARGIEDRIDTLRRLTAANPPQAARVGRLRDLVRERLVQMDRDLAVSKEQGLMAARQTQVLDLHKETRMAIRGEIAALKETESDLLAKRLANSKATYQQARSLNLLAGALGLLALGAFVFLVDKNLRSRELAAREISRQRETLRVTLASIGDGVIATDLAGRVVFLNGEAETLTGWTTAQAAGRPLDRIFRAVDEETRLPAENSVARALRGGVAPGVARHSVLIAKTGAERPIDDSAAPIRDLEGNVAGVVLAFRDVTEERAATNQLRELASRLSEADRRKNEFLAMLAHEIRNPLAAIRNSVAILKLSDRDPQSAAAAQGAIERQMEHLVRLVEDLLDLGRVSRGKLALRRSRIDLRQAIAQAVEACRPTYARSGQVLEVEIADTPLLVDGDSTRITQAIGNLLSNASKFTPRGGRIELLAGRDAAEVFVRVRDNGIGIAAENLSGLFDMFSQIDTSLERAQGGLGIGLNLVRLLVEMHGGRVEALSEGLGHGSEFVVHLPLLTAEAQDLEIAVSSGAAPAAEVANKQEGAGAAVPLQQRARRILVVDDNVDSADSLAMLLRLHGHQAEVARDGREAVEVALRTLPEVVLLDIGLPKLNGYEVARRIRLSPQGQETRIIALTGWGQDEDRKLSSAAGFDEHLVKPVDHARLLAMLEGPWSPRAKT